MAAGTQPKSVDKTPAEGEAVNAAELPPSAKVDVVAVPSLRADGTPDQTPGFVTFGESVEHAKERQAKTQDEAQETEEAVKAVVSGDQA